MNRYTLFFILSLSLSLNSRASFAEVEAKQAWTKTGFNFEILFHELNVDHCYQNEKRFSACLMAFHELLLSAREDESYQLRVSSLNELEIIPFQQQDYLKIEDVLKARSKHMESFRSFFRKIRGLESHDTSTTPTEASPETETSSHMIYSNRKQAPALLAEQFNNIVRQIFEFTRAIGQEDQSYFAGQTYNVFLKESLDPNSSLLPEQLTTPKTDIFFGIGVNAVFYEKENGNLNLVVDPYEGSPAQMAGLGKGDFIFGVDDLDIRKLSPDIENFENLMNKIRGPENTQVKLKIHSFCENQEKEITVTRGPIYYFPDWLKDNHFVNLHQQEPLGCESETRPASDKPGTEWKDHAAGLAKKSRETPGPQLSSSKAHALYVPLKYFSSSHSPPPDNPSVTPLCLEFLDLQRKDLRNPLSLGMIIDLRGNPGGYLHEVSCLLNTLINDDGVIVREQPVKEGKLLETPNQGQTITYYFTRGGFSIGSHSHPAIYNRNIVVLVDRESASASEVFAGTIQEMKRGWVIGDRTSGKGSVQQHVPLHVQKSLKPLQLTLTTSIYTLNSGRSPQGYGIIPDFRFSDIGEPIEDSPDDISFGNHLIFEDIQFKNNQWKQNRPEELAQLNGCVKNHQWHISESLKKKIREDKKYDRPFVVDYPLELAKDILTCMPLRPSITIQPYYNSHLPLLKVE